MTKVKFSMYTVKRTQKGVVLIVGLVMVLLISIVALAAIRGSGLQEIMAGNIYDRSLAFQASEAALSLGEEQVNFRRGRAPLCDNSVQTTPKCFSNLDLTPANSVQYYDDAKFTSNGNTTSMNLMSLVNIQAEPVYVIEELATFTPDDGSARDKSAAADLTKLTAYRVTAKGVGANAKTQVHLQSTYNRSAH